MPYRDSTSDDAMLCARVQRLNSRRKRLLTHVLDAWDAKDHHTKDFFKFKSLAGVSYYTVAPRHFGRTKT